MSYSLFLSCNKCYTSVSRDIFWGGTRTKRFRTDKPDDQVPAAWLDCTRDRADRGVDDIGSAVARGLREDTGAPSGQAESPESYPRSGAFSPCSARRCVRENYTGGVELRS